MSSTPSKLPIRLRRGALVVMLLAIWVTVTLIPWPETRGFRFEDSHQSAWDFLKSRVTPLRIHRNPYHVSFYITQAPSGELTLESWELDDGFNEIELESRDNPDSFVDRMIELEKDFGEHDSELGLGTLRRAGGATGLPWVMGDPAGHNVSVLETEPGRIDERELHRFLEDRLGSLRSHGQDRFGWYRYTHSSTDYHPWAITANLVYWAMSLAIPVGLVWIFAPVRDRSSTGSNNPLRDT